MLRRTAFSIAAVSMCMLAVAVPPSVQAIPIAIWTQPWQVTLGAPLVFPPLYAGATNGFGALGLANEALPGTTGVANTSSNVVTTDLTFPSRAVIDVKFTRIFQLSGSPNDWLVTLTSSLDGTLSVAGFTDQPRASVTADAEIVSEPSTNEPYFMQAITALNQDPKVVPVNLKQMKSIILPDGTYMVYADILTNASVNSYLNGLIPGDPAGAASSIFPSSFNVSVDAAPFTGTVAQTTPEPSYAAACGAVLLLLGVRKWQRGFIG